MKKCPSCGREHDEQIVRCPDDNEPLTETTAAVSSASAVPQSVAVLPLVGLELSDRAMRYFEMALICAIAFGGSILYCLHPLFDSDYKARSWTAYSWVNQIFEEGVVLGLLWYILTRRKKSFSDLGLSWRWMDLVWSMILYVAYYLAFYIVYHALYHLGLTPISVRKMDERLAYLSFGDGDVPFVAFVFQFVNPFLKN